VTGIGCVKAVKFRFPVDMDQLGNIPFILNPMIRNAKIEISSLLVKLSTIAYEDINSEGSEEDYK